MGREGDPTTLTEEEHATSIHQGMEDLKAGRIWTFHGPNVTTGLRLVLELLEFLGLEGDTEYWPKSIIAVDLTKDPAIARDLYAKFLRAEAMAMGQQLFPIVRVVYTVAGEEHSAKFDTENRRFLDEHLQCSDFLATTAAPNIARHIQQHVLS